MICTAVKLRFKPKFLILKTMLFLLQDFACLFLGQMMREQVNNNFAYFRKLGEGCLFKMT